MGWVEVGRANAGSVSSNNHLLKVRNGFRSRKFPYIRLPASINHPITARLSECRKTSPANNSGLRVELRLISANSATHQSNLFADSTSVRGTHTFSRNRAGAKTRVRISVTDQANVFSEWDREESRGSQSQRTLGPADAYLKQRELAQISTGKCRLQPSCRSASNFC